MPDIVERLRGSFCRTQEPDIGVPDFDAARNACREAADEIERLRAEKSQLHGALQLANRNYAEARNEALEEAARVAEYNQNNWIAAAVRALAAQEKEP